MPRVERQGIPEKQRRIEAALIDQYRRVDDLQLQAVFNLRQPFHLPELRRTLERLAPRVADFYFRAGIDPRNTDLIFHDGIHAALDVGLDGEFPRSLLSLTLPKKEMRGYPLDITLQISEEGLSAETLVTFWTGSAVGSTFMEVTHPVLREQRTQVMRAMGGDVKGSHLFIALAYRAFLDAKDGKKKSALRAFMALSSYFNMGSLASYMGRKYSEHSEMMTAAYSVALQRSFELIERPPAQTEALFDYFWKNRDAYMSGEPVSAQAFMQLAEGESIENLTYTPR